MIRIITSLVAVLTIGSMQAQVSPQEAPKLVVGITIDQLRGDYLQQFKHAFGERGFKRLLAEGLVYQNMSFDFPNLNDASTLATIYTGANPIYHDIASSHKYSIDSKQVVSVFSDDNFLGNYTQDKLSPKALKVSTITDELKIASNGSSDVFSFAPQASQALITAGHAGNTAFWVDEYSGKWSSTTYYKNFYWTVDQDNRSNESYAAKAWGMQWSPLSDQKSTTAFPYTKSEGSFQQSLGANKETYKLFKSTPFVNESMRASVVHMLSKADLGKRAVPDFLSLTFYAGKYPKSADYSVEIKDTYIRLDRDIENILNEIDKAVGLNNALIFVTSTGYYKSDLPSEDVETGAGAFYANRCEALLNMYLMALYGENQKWVDRYFNGQIYLNRALIKEKKLELKDVQQVAADFVSEFSGVQSVYTSYQLLNNVVSDDVVGIKKGLSKTTTGDLIVEIQPGFKVLNEQGSEDRPTHVRSDIISCPVIFFGNNIKAERIKRVIRATEIAPTVAFIMRIRAPSAAKDLPLVELQ